MNWLGFGVKRSKVKVQIWQLTTVYAWHPIAKWWNRVIFSKEENEDNSKKSIKLQSSVDVGWSIRNRLSADVKAAGVFQLSVYVNVLFRGCGESSAV